MTPLDRDVDDINPTPDSLACTVLPGFGYELFDFQPNSCQFMDQMENIDVDGNPEYSSINLTVKIEDASGLINTRKVHITVYDINDNTPLFNPGSYSAAVDGKFV